MYKFYDKVDSTQYICQEEFNEMNNCDYVIAGIQTKGYGVSGPWESEYKNIYFSQVIKSKPTDISFKVMLGIYNFLNDNNIDCKIKLPNDFYIGSKKLCGFIIEPFEQGYIIGIGINVYQPISIDKVSMNAMTDCEYDIEKLAISLNDFLIASYDSYSFDKFKDAVNIVNKEIKFIIKKSNRLMIGVVDDFTPYKILVNDIWYNIMEIKFVMED